MFREYVSKYSIKSRLFSVSFHQPVTLYVMRDVRYFLTQSTFLLHESKSISFYSSNISMCQIFTFFKFSSYYSTNNL